MGVGVDLQVRAMFNRPLICDREVCKLTAAFLRHDLCLDQWFENFKVDSESLRGAFLGHI